MAAFICSIHLVNYQLVHLAKRLFHLVEAAAVFLAQPIKLAFKDTQFPLGRIISLYPAK